jgi:hypothetical protein
VTDQKQSAQTGNKPTFEISAPKPKTDPSSETFWQSVGAGWQTPKGIKIVLSALPLTPRLFMAHGKDSSDNVVPDGNLPAYTISIASTPAKEGDKPFWTQIGTGWLKKRGISIELQALPFDGQMMMFEIDHKQSAPK